MPTLSKLQLGKQGITDNFITTLKSHFKKHSSVKISVLKSANRHEIKNYEQKIVDKLGPNFTARTIGFTINIKKWRRAVSGEKQ